MADDIRWKQRFDNYQRALHQLTLAVRLMDHPQFLALHERLIAEL